MAKREGDPSETQVDLAPEKRAPHEVPRMTYDPHPLFPRDDGTPEDADIRFVSFIRRTPGTGVKRCPGDFPASEMQSWQQAVERYGGGEYQAVAKDKNHRIIRHCPNANEWMSFEGQPKPLVKPGALTPRASRPPVAAVQPLPPEIVALGAEMVALVKEIRARKAALATLGALNEVLLAKLKADRAVRIAEIEAETKVRVAQITAEVEARARARAVRVRTMAENRSVLLGLMALRRGPEEELATLLDLLKRHGYIREARGLVQPAVRAATTGGETKPSAEMFGGVATQSLAAEPDPRRSESQAPRVEGVSLHHGGEPLPLVHVPGLGMVEVIAPDAAPTSPPAAPTDSWCTVGAASPPAGPAPEVFCPVDAHVDSQVGRRQLGPPAAPSPVSGSEITASADAPCGGIVTASLGAGVQAEAETGMPKAAARSAEEKLATLLAMLASHGYIKEASGLAPRATPASAIGSEIEPSTGIVARSLAADAGHAEVPAPHHDLEPVSLVHVPGLGMVQVVAPEAGLTRAPAGVLASLATSDPPAPAAPSRGLPTPGAKSSVSASVVEPMRDVHVMRPSLPRIAWLRSGPTNDCDIAEQGLESGPIVADDAAVGGTPTGVLPEDAMDEAGDAAPPGCARSLSGAAVRRRSATASVTRTPFPAGWTGGRRRSAASTSARSSTSPGLAGTASLVGARAVPPQEDRGFADWLWGRPLRAVPPLIATG
jgi:hypothetical protein